MCHGTAQCIFLLHVALPRHLDEVDLTQHTRQCRHRVPPPSLSASVHKMALDCTSRHWGWPAILGIAGALGAASMPPRVLQAVLKQPS